MRPRAPSSASAVKNRWVRTRMYVATALTVIAFGAMAYKAYGIQVTGVDHYRNLARRQHLHKLEIPAPRGFIYDAKGRELAVTADVDSVFASPVDVTDVTGTAEALAEVLDLDVRVLEERLSAHRHFVWIKRRVAPSEAQAVRDLDLPGIELMTEPRRFYPGKTLAATVLGFSGIDGNGLEGIEKAVDELLVGRKAKLPALRDATGKLMLAEGDGEGEAQPGASITLTIDRSIQFIAERALEQAITTHEAKAGTILVLDVATSEVLAMANWPTFDPNHPASADPQARNRAVTDSYEIGSAMKLFTVSAALEAGVITPSTVIDVERGRMRVARKVIRDSYDDRELDIGGIIKRSSNVGAAKIAMMLGPERLHDALLHFGFGAATGIELPGEQSGLVRDPDRWGRIGLATIAYGYGMTSTPLQMAAGVAALGDHGIYHEPRLIKRAVAADGTVLYQHHPVGRRIMSAKTASEILPMMASVFEKGKQHGTAHHVEVPGYDVGGKTSTAHKVDPKTHLYGAHLYLSSFVGLAPLHAPRIAVVVVIDEPHGKAYYGAQVAGPAFAQVVSETLRYLGEPTTKPDQPAGKAKPDRDRPEEAPTDQDQQDEPEDLSTAAFQDREDTVVVPDFTGLSVARALDVARDLGLSVEVTGSGVALEQTPPPGLAARSAPCRITFGHAPSRGAPPAWPQPVEESCPDPGKGSCLSE